jgi:hypothetical protein
MPRSLVVLFHFEHLTCFGVDVHDLHVVAVPKLNLDDELALFALKLGVERLAFLDLFGRGVG